MRGIGFAIVGLVLLVSAAATGIGLAAVAAVGSGAAVGALAWRVRRAAGV